MSKRFKIEIEYKGTNFSGWQIQPNAHTVEGELEAAFRTVLQEPIDLIGQGRTDAGVHAKGQVAHFDLKKDFESKKLIRAVNSLVSDIYITSIQEVDTEFHSRFDAISRSYTYTVLKYPSPIKEELGWYPGFSLDIHKLQECASLIVGEHDFEGFSKYNEENYTTICTILKAEWKERNEEFNFEIEANRFLRNMVRRIVGTTCEVARGRLTKVDFINMLKNKKGALSNYTAPSKGLVLQKINFQKMG